MRAAGRCSDATAVLEQASELSPLVAPFAWIEVGRCMVDIAGDGGTPAEELQHYRRAIAATPRLGIAYVVLGQRLCAHNRADEAAQLVAKAVRQQLQPIALLYEVLGLAYSILAEVDETALIREQRMFVAANMFMRALNQGQQEQPDLSHKAWREPSAVRRLEKTVVTLLQAGRHRAVWEWLQGLGARQLDGSAAVEALVWQSMSLRHIHSEGSPSLPLSGDSDHLLQTAWLRTNPTGSNQSRERLRVFAIAYTKTSTCPPLDFELDNKVRFARHSQLLLASAWRDGWLDVYVLPHEYSKAKAALMQGTWVLKPACLSNAESIRIMTAADSASLPEQGRWVLQRHVDRPLLLRGHKFDIRLYLVVRAIRPLRAYIHTAGLVRFASEPYRDDGTWVRAQHFTAMYPQPQQLHDLRDVRALWPYLRQQHGLNTSNVWEQIKARLRIILHAAHTNLTMRDRPQRECLKLYGLDVMLSSAERSGRATACVLEINKSPDMHMYHPEDYDIKGAVMRDLVSLTGGQHEAAKGKPLDSVGFEVLSNSQG